MGSDTVPGPNLLGPTPQRVSLTHFANGHYGVGSAEDLGFQEDARVDVVYLSSVFHWVRAGKAEGGPEALKLGAAHIREVGCRGRRADGDLVVVVGDHVGAHLPFAHEFGQAAHATSELRRWTTVFDQDFRRPVIEGLHPVGGRHVHASILSQPPAQSTHKERCRHQPDWLVPPAEEGLHRHRHLENPAASRDPQRAGGDGQAHCLGDLPIWIRFAPPLFICYQDGVAEFLERFMR